MRFEIVHEFDIPLDTLELAVISPSLISKLDETVRAMGVSVRSVTERSRNLHDGVLERVCHYQASLRLPKFAQGHVTPEMTAWDEATRYDTAPHAGTWTIVPDVKPEWREYFSAAGTYALEGLGDGRSRRTVRGEIELRVRVVRQVAERLIVGEVRKAFEAEAATLRAMATL